MFAADIVDQIMLEECLYELPPIGVPYSLIQKTAKTYLPVYFAYWVADRKGTDSGIVGVVYTIGDQNYRVTFEDESEPQDDQLLVSTGFASEIEKVDFPTGLPTTEVYFGEMRCSPIPADNRETIVASLSRVGGGENKTERERPKFKVA